MMMTITVAHEPSSMGAISQGASTLDECNYFMSQQGLSAITGWASKDYFMSQHEWVQLLREPIWMSAVISWASMNEWSYFISQHEWVQLLHEPAWMSAVASWASMNECSYVMRQHEWVQLLHEPAWMSAVTSWASMNECSYFMSQQAWVPLLAPASKHVV